MKTKKKIVRWGWLLFLPLLGGCTTSDDVQGIFTGRTWKMTYISQDKLGGWYIFPDVTDSNYNDYNPTTGTKSFNITFTGSEHDHVITGNLTGKGSVTMDGTWNANGESNTFNAVLKNSHVLQGDKLGAKIVEAINNADEYAGDYMNLYLYFTYEQDRLYIAFKPVN